MQLGDVILRFGDRVPTDDRELLRLIASSPPGEKVTITVLRGGKQVELPVTLAEWPKMQWEERDAPIKAAQPHWTIPPDLGISVAAAARRFPHQEFISRRAARTLRPCWSAAIRKNAEAARRGLAVGDLILRVDDVPVGSAADLQQQIDRARAAHRSFALFLIVPKTASDKGSKFPGPKWIALRVSPG